MVTSIQERDRILGDSEGTLRLAGAALLYQRRLASAEKYAEAARLLAKPEPDFAAFAQFCRDHALDREQAMCGAIGRLAGLLAAARIAVAGHREADEVTTLREMCAAVERVVGGAE